MDAYDTRDRQRIVIGLNRTKNMACILVAAAMASQEGEAQEREQERCKGSNCS